MTARTAITALSARIFARDRRAGIALVTGLGMVPLFLSAGIAIDLSRVTQFRVALQQATDSAALAGAAVYNSTGNETAAKTAAQNYMSQAMATLPKNSGVTYTATPGTPSTNGAVTNYTVAVAAKASVPTTVLSFIIPTVPTNVGATGLNPVITLTASLGNWKSSAWDANTIYWYVVPTNGSLPAASAMHALFTNTGPAPTSLPSIQITAGQSIGFALKNVTGGIHGYGPNQYGSAQGHTNWLYSQLSPPSKNAYPTFAKNCALQVVVATSSNPSPTETAGSCYSATPANATVNCAQTPGKSIYFFWNDMGGGKDDYDYNDAQYSITCPSMPANTDFSANSSGKVLLTQ